MAPVTTLARFHFTALQPVFQDDVVDRCIETQRPEESGAILLPEGDFIDGMLGILLANDLVVLSPTAEDGEIKVRISGDEAVMELVGTLEEGELFSDPDFPASSASLSYSDPGNEGLQDIMWVRPQVRGKGKEATPSQEMCERPQLFVDGISRSDVKQGILGDCWFLSACASVAKRPELIEKVVAPGQPLPGDGYKGLVAIKFCLQSPGVVAPGQPLSGDGYKGLVAIKFWRFGYWVTVYIDDRLPCRNGALLYASCADKSEFWVAFVEKAYAKLHGSYESLAGGHALEAFVDLTGGLAERHEVTPDLFRKLRVAFSHGGFVTCARKGDWQTEACKDTAVNGLVQGHAYTVTDIRRVEVEDRGSVQMIRVRNPWADDSEWTGPWSDRFAFSTKRNSEIMWLLHLLLPSHLSHDPNTHSPILGGSPHEFASK
uniref:Calpain catalytic domain-containing protein n=1 Tax=Timema shepardi TaxID=629360 RepID=A0A7R9AYE1_TIMSH|nr:unnamed protein product [Timema shepardi]